MRRVVYSSQFHRDVKRARKRGKDTQRLKTLMALLIAAKPLPASYQDHPLKGKWRVYRDAHIEPDWLLLYKIDGDTVRFERTGRHVDLFKD